MLYCRESGGLTVKKCGNQVRKWQITHLTVKPQLQTYTRRQINLVYQLTSCFLSGTRPRLHARQLCTSITRDIHWQLRCHNSNASRINTCASQSDDPGITNLHTPSGLASKMAPAVVIRAGTCTYRRAG